jgi:hypothetical protein
VKYECKIVDGVERHCYQFIDEVTWKRARVVFTMSSVADVHIKASVTAEISEGIDAMGQPRWLPHDVDRLTAIALFLRPHLERLAKLDLERLDLERLGCPIAKASPCGYSTCPVPGHADG